MNRLLLPVVIIVVLIGVAILTKQYIDGGRDYQTMIQVRDQLQIGMTRDEVEDLMSMSVSHRICDYEPFSMSLYYFRGGDYHVLMLRFDKSQGQELLEGVFEPEPYQLQAEPLASCVIVE